MDKFSVEGAIVRVSETGESDRILWILTRSEGIIRAFAKGARKVRGKLHSSTAMFVYGTFWLTESKGAFNVTDVEVKEMFFNLRTDLEALTLSQYFCEIAVKCVDENAGSEEHLRLLLNSLYFLSSKTKPALYLKSVYEIRTACILGYAPNVIACDRCGEYETPSMYFDCTKGTLYCEKCGNPDLYPKVSAAEITAIRHIVFSPFGKIFSYDYTGTDLEALNRLTEQYFLNCVQLHFETLDFYRKQ